MNLKPLDDRIVVKPNEAEQTTASGLVIPDTAKEKPQQGTVLAVGPGRWSDDAGSTQRSTSKSATQFCTASTAVLK
jgi:chaperonin GroES